MSVISDPAICQLLLVAWRESKPGTDLAHEEGSFILRQSDGALTVERWPHGLQDEISVPVHTGGKRNGLTIIATFHTHPNPGAEYLQAPGPTDILFVCNDANLNHPEYEGEFVLAAEWTYKIAKSGVVTIAGKTDDVLNIE